jgi:hypothetical protein
VTFSDKAVVEFVKKHFVPVWESVAPVRVTTFQLGGGRKVTGINNGEIALYVCRPDGKVIHMLPGLRSPQETLDFLVSARSLLRSSGGDEAKVRAFHSRGAGGAARSSLPTPLTVSTEPATVDIRAMARKSLLVTPTETAVIVRPKGPAALRSEVAVALAGRVLQAPGAWKRHVFEELLEEPLEGGRREFGPASLRIR